MTSGSLVADGRKANPNLTLCTECGEHLSEKSEYHPYAFCVLIKAGLNPLAVVLDAAKALGVGRVPA